MIEREWDIQILEEERRVADAIPAERRDELLPHVGIGRAAIQDLRDAGFDVVSLHEGPIFAGLERAGPVLSRRLGNEENILLAEDLARIFLHAPSRCPEAVAALVASMRRFGADHRFVLVSVQALAVHVTAGDREAVAPTAEREFWPGEFDGRGMVLEFVLLKIDKALAGRTAEAVLREVHPSAEATWAQANPVRSALTGVARLKRHDLRELVEARLEDPIPGLREGARETIKKLDRDRDRREARA